MKKLLVALWIMATSLQAGQLTKPPAPKDSEIIKMWQCPMPDDSKPLKGFDKVPGVEHFLIFKATEATGGYNHHSKIFFWEGKFYALWSNHRYAEDAAGQRILLATSDDGKNWSLPKEIFPALYPEAPWGTVGINLSANRIFTWEGKLFARAWCGATTGWENQSGTSQQKYHSAEFCFAIRTVYEPLYREIKKDGSFGPIFTFGKELPDDTIYRAIDGAQLFKNFPHPKSKEYDNKTYPINVLKSRRLCEATPYRLANGNYAVLFRDDSYSHRKFVSFSKDNINWSTPQPTNIPDSPSESKAISLDDGSVILVGNHMVAGFEDYPKRHCGRDPLVVSVSKDGLEFTKSWAVHWGPHNFTIPRKKVKGRGGVAQYPSIIIHDDKLYVMYSIGKEDIGVSIFPLASIGLNERKPKYNDTMGK